MVKHDFSQFPYSKLGNQVRDNWLEFWRDQIKPGLQEPRLNRLKDQASELLIETGRRVLQVAGARAVDAAILRLGLGRSGVRLTAASMGATTERWEAELVSWTPAAIAEASDVVCTRALRTIFSLESAFGGGPAESARIESMTIRWLVPVPPHSISAAAFQSSPTSIQGDGKLRGIVGLNWPVDLREEYRRQVLSQIHQGATTSLTAMGWSHDGRKIVEVDIVIEARARAQLAGR